MSIRDTLKQAMESVERELQENDHKGGWEVSDIGKIQGHLWIEMRELEDALILWQMEPSQENRDRIEHEAADVQAMAMMVADLAGCYRHELRMNGESVAPYILIKRLINEGWDSLSAEIEVERRGLVAQGRDGAKAETIVHQRNEVMKRAEASGLL